jgi:hypothetical protein
MLFCTALQFATKDTYGVLHYTKDNYGVYTTLQFVNKGSYAVLHCTTVCN